MSRRAPKVERPPQRLTKRLQWSHQQHDATRASSVQRRAKHNALQIDPQRTSFNGPAAQRGASTGQRLNAALQRASGSTRRFNGPAAYLRRGLICARAATDRPANSAGKPLRQQAVPTRQTRPRPQSQRWSTRETHSASETSKPGASEPTAPTGRHVTVPSTQPVDNSRPNVRGRSQPRQLPGPVHTNAQLTTTLRPSVSAATPRPTQPCCRLQPRQKARLIHSRWHLIHTLQACGEHCPQHALWTTSVARFT